MTHENAIESLQEKFSINVNQQSQLLTVSDITVT